MFNEKYVELNDLRALCLTQYTYEPVKRSTDEIRGQ